MYCEPERFLTEAERESFEPIAFYGSLAALEELEALNRLEPPPAFAAGDGPRVYVSFGTLIWRYFTEPALAAFGAVADALEATPGARGLISLGGNDPGPDAVAALTRDNVTVADYVDQWQVLRETDVCVTHNGMNTTHEAVFQGVPMTSYTFFADQPALARRCEELGMAVPLAERPLQPVSPDDVLAALARVEAEGDAMRARLAEAREWEIETIAARGAVIDRMTDLVGAAA
jgi:zeaxanthin glucosyltransferase